MRQTPTHVNLDHFQPADRPGHCSARGRKDFGMNKVASTSWISVVILIAIVITALVLYNN